MPKNNAQDSANSRKRQTPATIKDVAEQAGVSIATVSRVLSEIPGANLETIAKVKDAANALNYRPNRAARTLRKKTARVVGVVISDIQNPFFTSVVRGIESVLEKADYILLLSNSDEDPKRENSLLAILKTEGVAGIILAPAKSDSEALRQFTRTGIPLVTIDRAIYKAKVDAVLVNNQGGSESAVAHLASLGHTRIGFISGPDQVSTGYERKQGYMRQLQHIGIPVQGEFIRYGDFRQAGGYIAMLELLDQTPRPTAVLSANNLMTLGALQAIHERGLKIPDQIAVVGFDDMSWSTSLLPPLTVVSQPTYDLGTVAAELVLERIAAPDRPVRQIILETQLIIRASSSVAETIK